ncbi:MAG: hypothetical protein M1839_004544 [Geoglossum umbratile]|nr:MAG: hypothetical protein M1839_004544 [Geoglossum umbratile]
MEFINNPPKRISYAEKPGKPEVWSKDEKTSTSTTTTDATTADARSFHTHVKIFLLSTGDDPGSECELRGWISFPGTQPVVNVFEIDMPILTSFANENFGLGRLLAELSTDSSFQPAQFQAFLNEDDIAGIDWILQQVFDWTNPSNSRFADGNAWVLRSRNSADHRYVCNMWFQVTPPV